ncbi:hypothetical protein JL720_9313 [Aureococcus anophagefferens]|nr:hypothetical protein JL720_9313 [Aureococcus anophagefferens]
MFLTKEQFAKVLELTPEVGHKHFSYFDQTRRGRVSATEIWGALALCCSDREEPKAKHLKSELALTKDLLDLYNFILFLKADDAIRRYLASLERAASADAEDLYKQQADLMLELAQIDSRLNEIDWKRAREAEDARAYEAERGGDEAEVVHGDGESRAAAAARKRAHDEGTAMVKKSDTAGYSRKSARSDQKALASYYARRQSGAQFQAAARNRQAAQRENERMQKEKEDLLALRKTKKDAPRREGDDGVRDDDAVMLNAQLERRAQEGARGPRRRPRRRQRRRADGLVRLDVDMFEDVFEALGNVLIRDDEAEAALAALPRNAVRAYALDDVVGWWRAREAAKIKPRGVPSALAAWDRIRSLRTVADGWKAKLLGLRRRLGDRSRATLGLDRGRGDVRVGEQDFDEEASELSDGSDAKDLASVDSSVVKRLAGHRAGDGLVGAAVAGGAAPPAPPDGANADLDHGSEDPTPPCVDALKTPPPALGIREDEDLDDLSDHVEKAQKDTCRLDVTASELISLDYRRALLDVMRGVSPGEDGGGGDDERPATAASARPSTAASARPSTSGSARPSTRGSVGGAPPPKRLGVAEMKSVFWVDLPIEKSAEARAVVDLSREMEACARFVPRDYGAAYFDRVRSSAARTPSRTEAELPEAARPSKLLGKVSAQFELGSTLAELTSEAAKFHDMAARLWGPQEAELGDGGADPRTFRLDARRRRRDTLDLADRVDTMPSEELRDLLEAEGSTSVGAFARDPDGRGLGGTQARARLKAVLLRKAARVGFGELSAFGASIAEAIFKRFDEDERGGLDYDRFAALARKLGEVPPGDAAEYKRNASDAQVHMKVDKVKDKVKQTTVTHTVGVSQRGFVKQYERRGRLGADAQALGAGSLDDALQGQVTLTVELDADVAEKLEAHLVAHSRNSVLARLKSLWPLRALAPATASGREAAGHEKRAFLLRFVKGCFVDRVYARCTDIFPAGAAPNWLVAPAWLFYAAHAAREFLADGDRGLVPTLRTAVSEYFGDRWEDVDDYGGAAASFGDDELVRDPLGVVADDAAEPDGEVMSAAKAEAGVLRRAMSKGAGDYMEDLKGISTVTLQRATARGSALQVKRASVARRRSSVRALALSAGGDTPAAAPPPAEVDDDGGDDDGEPMLYDQEDYDRDFGRLLCGGDSDDDREIEEHEVMEGDYGLGDEGESLKRGPLDPSKATPEELEAEAAYEEFEEPGSAALVGAGATARAAFLREEIEVLDGHLAKKSLPRRHRTAFEQRKAARARELEVRTRALERRAFLGLARLVRAYDGCRDLCRGACGLGAGTGTVTLRGEFEGFLDAVPCARACPEGRGEPAALAAHEDGTHANAVERIHEAHRKNEAEKARIAREAEAAAQGAMAANRRRARAHLVEEATLYGKGAKCCKAALRAAAKFGPADSTADRKRLEAEEQFERLATLRSERRGPASLAHALAVGNAAALVASGFAKADLDRSRRMELLSAEAAKLSAEDPNSEERKHAIEARLEAIAKSLEGFRRDRFSGRAEAARGVPGPPRPDIRSDRHENAMLVLCILLANELVMLEEVGEPPDERESDRRDGNHAKCVACYACVSDRGRSRLDALNRRFSAMRDEDADSDSSSSSSSSDDEREDDDASAAADTPGGDDDAVDDSPLEDLWHRAGPYDDADAGALHVLGVGVELAGPFPPPSPQEIRDNLAALVIHAQKEKEAKARAKNLSEKQARKEAAKLRKMQRHMSFVTTFDAEQFKLLEMVNPKRAARIKAREQREAEAAKKREKREEALLESRAKAAALAITSGFEKGANTAAGRRLQQLGGTAPRRSSIFGRSSGKIGKMFEEESDLGAPAPSRRRSSVLPLLGKAQSDGALLLGDRRMSQTAPAPRARTRRSRCSARRRLPSSATPLPESQSAPPAFGKGSGRFALPSSPFAKFRPTSPFASSRRRRRPTPRATASPRPQEPPLLPPAAGQRPVAARERQVAVAVAGANRRAGRVRSALTPGARAPSGPSWRRRAGDAPPPPPPPDGDGASPDASPTGSPARQRGRGIRFQNAAMTGTESVKAAGSSSPKSPDRRASQEPDSDAHVNDL